MENKNNDTVCMESNTKNFEGSIPSSMKFTPDGHVKLYDADGNTMSQQYIGHIVNTRNQKSSILTRITKRIRLIIFALSHLDEIEKEFR